MGKGEIIILNGTSSSGKTSIAHSLKQVLDEPYEYVSIDDFLELITNRYFANLPPSEEIGKAGKLIIPKVVSLMHHTIAALALLGKNVIVDHVITDRNWLIECVDILSCFPVTFVGVHCPIEELERREIARGDRPIGLARSQLNIVHKDYDYDLIVDTLKNNSMDCALQIKHLQNTTAGGAFTRMRSSL